MTARSLTTPAGSPSPMTVNAGPCDSPAVRNLRGIVGNVPRLTLLPREDYLRDLSPGRSK